MNQQADTSKKQKSAEKRRSRRNKVSQDVWDYLTKNPCVECGEADPVLLEFDHLEQSTKVDTISRMVKNGCSQEKVWTAPGFSET